MFEKPIPLVRPILLLAGFALAEPSAGWDPALERAPRGSEPYAGSLPEQPTREAVDTLDLRIDAASLRSHLAGRSPLRKGPQEVVLGEDDRVLIEDTTAFPNRAIGLLNFDQPIESEFPFTAQVFCTAWLVAPDTIVTAAHCVHLAGAGSVGWSSEGTFYPGFDGRTAPFGSCRVTRWILPEPHYRTDDERFDYGAAKLDCNVGDVVGWLGFRAPSGSLDGLKAEVRGYPGDKGHALWGDSDPISAATARQVFYRADTSPGQSGSPVLEIDRRQAPCRGACVFAIHAQGAHLGTNGRHAANNHGVRITAPVVAFIRKAIAAPKFGPDLVL
jgi:V8-like Glu-specific endopeptidase